MPEQLSIKKWRVMNDMLQQDVADKLGVSRKTVGAVSYTHLTLPTNRNV